MSEYKNTSILEFILERSSQYSQAQLFVMRRKIRKEVYLYKDLPGILARLEAFFRQEKIPVGAMVILWGMNCPEYASLLLSCFSFGRIAVPIDFRTSDTVLTRLIEKTRPKVAFVSAYFKSDTFKAKNIKVYEIESLFQSIKNIKGTKSVSQLRKEKTYQDPNRIIEIVFTSGTTGIPKGVVIKGRNILANLSSIAPVLPDIGRGRIISILPLSHMLEQVVGLFLALCEGATVFYLPRITGFRLLVAFRQYRPTHQIFVPQLLKIFWGKIEDRVRKEGKWNQFQFALKIAQFLPGIVRRQLFSEIHKSFGGALKLIACGGAPLDVTVGQNFEKIGIPVIEGYGATEVTAAATFNRLGKIRLGTVGTPLPDVSIKVDPIGEIFINSPAITSGYYRDTIRSQRVFTKDGYRTGDIGRIDNDGYLIIIGRDDFKIVTPSGEKIFVEDLERIIEQDDRVESACVLGKRLSDGDRVHAFFLLNKGVKTSLTQIVADINARLESKQQITSFSLWKEDDFPRTSTLKIDRKFVAGVLNEKSHGSVKKEAVKYQLTDIIDVVARVAGIAKENIKNSDLLTTDLGLDSLSRVELVSLAEEYLDILLDETKISARTTVGDLARLANAATPVENIFLPTWQFGKFGEFLRAIIIKAILIPLHARYISIHYPQKKLPEIAPGSIIIFNHPGPGDGVCLIRTLSQQGNLKIMTDATFSLWQPRKLIAKLLETIAGGLPLYESGTALISVLTLNSDLMDRGYNLLFAPQGTMQRGENEDPFKPGIGYLVKELDRPVTIFRIKGYKEIWPPPKEDIAKAKLADLLPHKKGTVDVVVSSSIYRDWSRMSVIQITNLLEEKYKEL